MRVVSYNILCSTLAPADRFCHCNPEDLAAPTRLERIFRQLDAEVERGAVVCLQEVGRGWAGELHKYFADKGFYFVHSGYGEAFNDYMGVGIAFPHSRFKLVDTAIKRVSESKPWPKEQKPEPRDSSATALAAKPFAVVSALLSAFLASPARALFGGLLSILPARARAVLPAGSSSKPQKCPWAVAETRKNTCVFVRLRGKEGPDQGSLFCVATYHMPCVFWDQRVMVIHSALVAQTVQQLAGADPHILAGDFNFKPHSSPYKLVTQGHLSPSDEFYVEPSAPDSWRVDLLEGMRSAYAQVSHTLLPASEMPFPSVCAPSDAGETPTGRCRARLHELCSPLRRPALYRCHRFHFCVEKRRGACVQAAQAQRSSCHCIASERGGTVRPRAHRRRSARALSVSARQDRFHFPYSIRPAAWSQVAPFRREEST